MSSKLEIHNRPRRGNIGFGRALLGAGLILLGLAISIALWKPWTLAQPSEASAIPNQVSFPAPELRLNDLEGKPISLVDYAGQVVLVNIWATWCPPCRAEMPELEAYYQDHRARGFIVVAVDAGDSAEEVARFVMDYGLSFPVLLDPRMAALATFRYPGLPSSYVIDRSGVVRLAWTGAINREQLDRHVTPLLED